MQTERIFTTRMSAALLVLLPSLLFSQPHDGWKLKRDKGDVKVYMRNVEGSKIKELKFTTNIRASLNTIAYVLTNVEGFDNWVYASVTSETIKKISDTEVYYYTEMDFPWPLSNRDLVLYSKFWQDPKTLALHSVTTSAHWMKPGLEDIVRITLADLRWSFTPAGNGNVHVDYYLKSDPGGSIPAWLVNLAADQGPMQTMVKFKDELKKEEYKFKKLAFVQEYE
jgi:START domain